jgi:hypothetical protein
MTAKASISRSNTRWGRRCTIHRPATTPTMTAGTSTAFSTSVSVRMSPRPALNGILKTLMMKKNQASVPTTSNFGSPTARQ